jgi:hypothetical protein
MMACASWSIHRINNDGLFIVDDNLPGSKSVTNDAEFVCQTMIELYGNRRLFYRDTMGRWDELIHDRGRFLRFAPGIMGR